MKNEEYKKLSIAEFTKAAGRYESNHAGIYEMCKKDYPDILEELEKEPFRDLLDAGCGPASGGDVHGSRRGGDEGADPERH